MSDFQQMLKAEYYRIGNRLKTGEAFLTIAPEGNLRVSVSRKGKAAYYQSLKGKKSRYLSPVDASLIQTLAQKDYYLKALPLLKKQERVLRSFLKAYDPYCLRTLHAKLPWQRKNLIEPFEKDDETFIREWLAAPKLRENKMQYNNEIYTNLHIRVRSRIEKIDADHYEYRGVPYRVEDAIKLEGYGWVFPDFSLLNVRTRETIYHEHFGMMDDPQYRQKTLEKIRAYARNGYMQGVNIFFTFEDGGNPLDTRELDYYIDQYLK